MTSARASGIAASTTRRQNPAISSLSVRPIKPASVTQALRVLKAASSTNCSSLHRQPCHGRNLTCRDYSFSNATQATGETTPATLNRYSRVSAAAGAAIEEQKLKRRLGAKGGCEFLG